MDQEEQEGNRSIDTIDEAESSLDHEESRQIDFEIQSRKAEAGPAKPGLLSHIFSKGLNALGKGGNAIKPKSNAIAPNQQIFPRAQRG